MSEVTIKTLLDESRKKLDNVSDSPALDSELLLAHCLGKNRIYLHTWPDKTVTTIQKNKFDGFVTRRETGYPVAYLVGTKAFWTIDLIVTPDVLIPRPETELLVETALEKIRDVESPKILDLGTGSGAIALALASERPDAKIVACDFSSRALSIARKNAEKHQLDKRVTFIESDWFSNIEETDFDLIVSNPPYIQPHDPHLKKEIRFEPQQALVSKDDGLRDIKIIINNSPTSLTNEGWLLIEHGYNQKQQITNLIQKMILYRNHKIVNDLNGNPRISLCQK